MNAVYYYTGLERNNFKEVVPKNGEKFTFDEVKEMIGENAFVDFIPLPTPDNKTYKVVFFDDEGKLKQNEINDFATKAVREAYAANDYAWCNEGVKKMVESPSWYLVGNVVIMDASYADFLEE